MKSLKATLKLGSSSNRYAPRLPQQETKSSTKQLAPTDPILGPEKLLKTGFAQKGLPSRDFPSRRVRKRPPQEDVAEFQRKCTELRRLATIQEVANPVSFALANSWTDTLKADKHHYLEHLTRCMT